MKTTDFQYDKYEKIAGARQITHHVSNEYIVEGNTVYVKLRWSEKEAIMLCDLEDWERLKGYTWGLGKAGGYPTTNVQVDKKHRVIKFHQIVMGQKEGYLVDHINQNPLDNRKENLRFVIPTANAINSKVPKNNKSGYKGVSWRKDSNKWRAQITIQGKIICLGTYERIEDAIEARRIAEDKYHIPYLETK